MPWASNPLLASSSTTLTPSPPTPDNDQDATSSQTEKVEDESHGFKSPTKGFTPHQIFYIFVLDGVGAAVVSGAINFSIAYGMYATLDTSKWPVRLWQFPYTLAGDGALSIPIQCTITWWLELWLVNRDLRRGSVEPIGFIPEPKHRILRWFMFLDRHSQDSGIGSRKHWLQFAGSQFTRALLVSLVSFVLMWGPSVAILTLFSLNKPTRFPCAGLVVPYQCLVAQELMQVAAPMCSNDWCYRKKWTPQIFKTVKGSMLGLLTTPLFVMFWLVRCGWALKSKGATTS